MRLAQEFNALYPGRHFIMRSESTSHFMTGESTLRMYNHFTLEGKISERSRTCEEAWRRSPPLASRQDSGCACVRARVRARARACARWTV